MNQAERFATFAATHGVNKDLKGKSIRGALFMASGRGLDLVLRVVGTTILARLLVPEHFGLIAMATAFTALVEIIKDLGLPAATLQKPDITHAEVTNLFWVNAVAGFVFTAAFYAVAPAIAAFYQEPRLVPIIRAISTTFLWAGLSVQHQALFTRQLRQGELAMVHLASSVLSLIVAALLAFGGWGYWALVWREVLMSAFGAIGLWMWCPWIPGLPNRSVKIGGLLRFGRNFSLTNFLIGVISNIDRLLIGRFYGPALAGMYRQAQQLMMVPIEHLNTPIAGVAQPGLSALQKEPQRYRRYYQKIVMLVCLTTVPLGLFVAIYAEELTLLVLGPAWSESAVFLRIFAVAAIFRPAIGTSVSVMVTCGQSARYLLVTSVHSVVLAALMLLGLRWGAVGVGIAHVSTTLLLMAPKLYYSFAGTPVRVRDFFLAAKTPAAAGLAMAIGLVWLRSMLPDTNAIYSLSIGAIAGAGLYLGVWLLIPDGRDQLRVLLRDVVASLQRKDCTDGKESSARAGLWNLVNPIRVVKQFR